MLKMADAIKELAVGAGLDAVIGEFMDGKIRYVGGDPNTSMIVMATSSELFQHDSDKLGIGNLNLLHKMLASSEDPVVSQKDTTITVKAGKKTLKYTLTGPEYISKPDSGIDDLYRDDYKEQVPYYLTLDRSIVKDMLGLGKLAGSDSVKVMIGEDGRFVVAFGSTITAEVEYDLGVLAPAVPHPSYPLESRMAFFPPSDIVTVLKCVHMADKDVPTRLYVALEENNFIALVFVQEHYGEGGSSDDTIRILTISIGA